VSFLQPWLGSQSATIGLKPIEKNSITCPFAIRLRESELIHFKRLPVANTHASGGSSNGKIFIQVSTKLSTKGSERVVKG